MSRLLDRRAALARRRGTASGRRVSFEPLESRLVLSLPPGWSSAATATSVTNTAASYDGTSGTFTLTETGSRLDKDGGPS